MLDYVDMQQRQLDQHPADQPTVTLSLIEDVSLRSFNWARLELGIPLPAEG